MSEATEISWADTLEPGFGRRVHRHEYAVDSDPRKGADAGRIGHGHDRLMLPIFFAHAGSGARASISSSSEIDPTMCNVALKVGTV